MRKIITQFFISSIVLLCLSQGAYAQKILESAAVKGELVRVTPKLTDIDPNSMYGKPLEITRNENGRIDKPAALRETKARLEREMKEQNMREYLEATGGISPESRQNPAPPPSGNPNVPSTTLGVNFDGATSPGLQPTDNNMAAGPNHVIQTVNNTSGTRFTIWNKSGTQLFQGILATLTGFSGAGDPIVLYDQLADRWFLAEFGPSACCSQLIMAVSTSPNPLGTWNIYRYIDASFFPDYPKWSVWHNAYYAYTNDFNSAGTAFLGTSVWAFDRAAMLAGAPTAQMVRQRLALPNQIAMGVVNLDGMTPSTQNGLFLVPSSATQLGVFEVTPNFVAPSISVGAIGNFTVNAWSTSAAIGQQVGGTLGSLSPRMMFRVGYRNNGGTESIVAAHTIGNGALGGVRWYELRRTAGVWGVFQQGNVFGTDGNSRWMPGIAMDGFGNIALMYDVAGNGTPAAHPSIRYTGRNACDPPNTMTLPESVIINATTNFGGFRWGDYNTCVPDYSAPFTPNNGSFWATSQYGNQLTRIANFSITNGCAIVANGSALNTETCVPFNSQVDPGETVTVTLNLRNNGAVPTTNLVATLQAAGNVVPITLNQNYGVIPAGGSVGRQFTFSNSLFACPGTVTATLQLQDGATNFGTVTFPFTIAAPCCTPPCVIVCPANITTNTAPGQCGANVTFSATTVGACGPITYTPASGSFFPRGTTTVTASTAAGPSCTFTVTVNDNIPPTAVCPANITVNNTPGQCGAVVNYTVTATDNCPGATVAIVSGPASGSVFPVGTTTVTWRATDASGNVSPNCSFTVTVVDNEAPVITCPANSTVNTPVGSCTAVVNYTITSSDNCPGVTTVRTAGPASGSAFPIGTTTVSWRATDAAGNISNCSFTVTVNDGQAPVINAQPTNQLGCVTGSKTFGVTASTAPNAGGPLSYQWQIWNGSAWVNVSGATASTLTLSNLTLAQNTNSYRCVVTGLCTSVTSNFATLYVNSLPTVSILASRTPVLLPSQSVNLTAVVNPGGGTYQWFKNNVAIAGATGATLNGLTVDDIGTYKLVYTDPNGCTQTSADMAVSGLASDRLYIYPNPNRGQFQVRFYNQTNEAVTVNIYNAGGQKIYIQQVVTGLAYSRIDVDITSKPNGTYVCEVVNSAGKVIGSRKFVKFN